MEISKDICKVIADIEFKIGSQCYNPSSYDGWNDVEGCEFRYPINMPNKSGEYTKIRLNINQSRFIKDDDISAQTIPFMKYKFGANELYIGKGIIQVLEYLEKRYDLDFNELENKKKQEEAQQHLASK